MSDSAPSSSSDEADIHTLANIATARWQHHHANSTTNHRRSPDLATRNDDLSAVDADAPSTSAAAARSSAPSRHDRRASKACQACRARKTRCDAQRPKCSYCRKHDIDCHYVAGDLRKQRPSKRRRSSIQPDHIRDESVPPPPPPPSLPAHRASPQERVEHSYAPSMGAAYVASSHPASSTRDAHSVASSHSSAWPALPTASVVTSVPDAATAEDVQFLPNDLIEALSGKVAWFDELERQSATSITDATRIHDTTTAHNIWSTASDVAAFDPMLADLLHQAAPSGSAAPAGKDRIIQLHYFRSFSGATAVTQGLKKISVRIRVPAELESMLIEAQNRTNLFDPAASGLDPQTLNLHSLLGTSRFMPSPNPAAASTSAAAHRTAFPAMHEAHTPSALSSAAYAEDLPEAPLRDLLISRFFLRLADHFPFLSRYTLEAQLARGSQVNPALINAMCALAARFVEPYETTMLSPAAAGTGGSVNASNDPDATADSVFGSAKPHSRGLRFAERAKSYMMSSITLPSVTTVATLVLLAWHEFGVNSDSGLWMFAGMAIRMSIDLGLHRRAKNNWFTAAPRADANDLIQPQPLFWCVFILDRTLSIGTGRPTSLKDQEITLDYPRTVLPIHPARKQTSNAASESAGSSRSSSTRPSVFGHLTRLMQKAGALAEIANNLGEDDDPHPLEELDKLEADMIGDYDALPAGLMLGEDQLRTSSEPRCLLSLHLWFHLLLMLMNRLPLSRLRAKPVASDESREILRHASQQIRNAVLYANAVDPMIHLGCPFTNQAFCLAGGFEASMAATLQRHEQLASSTAAGRRSGNSSGRASPAPRSLATLRARLRDDGGKGARSLFVQSHLEAYQRCVDALDKLTETWLGVTWIANALKARKTDETPDAALNGSASAGGSAAGETMLSLSELKVLLRLAASTVSSTEQPMSILEDSSNGASGSTSGSSNSAPSWTSPPTQPGKTTAAAAAPTHADHHLRPPPSRPSSITPWASHAASFEHSVGATSMPQHGALVEISDISHPDDLSHFLPFLSRPLP
ncbi:uncharacterized protein PSANT_06833 [Moesziomyces antarcticus]|nr:uncharacterized protein PSANT_06833 [Moesziomyces antarcticus]